MSLIGEWLARHLFDHVPWGVPTLDAESDDEEPAPRERGDRP